MPEFVLTLDVPQLLNLLLAVVFPVLVGLVTTKVTRSWVKAVLLATISLLSGLVTSLLAAVLGGVPFDVVAALLTGLSAWIIAIATHLGFWKPAGVTEKVQSIGSPPLPDEKLLVTKAYLTAMGDSLESAATINVFAAEEADPARTARVASELLRRDLRGD